MSESTSSSSSLLDCTNYNSSTCPKGLSYTNTLSSDTLRVLMVGCWGVYCWDGEIEVNEYDKDTAEANSKLNSNNSLGSDVLQLFKKKTEEYGQKSVVEAMKTFTSKNPNVEALFLAGDNVYNYNIPKDALITMLKQSKFPNKKQYKQDYTISGQNIEKQLSAGFVNCFKGLNVNNFYVGIGNHDIQNCHDLNTQLNYKQGGYNLPAVYYNVVYNLQGGYSVNFIMIDTNMFEENSQTCNPVIPYTDDDRKNQLDWVLRVLKQNKCKWNIIVGHSPYKANGHKSNKKTVYNKKLDDFFTAINYSTQKVQVYMCADEHNQQFLYDNKKKLSLVIAGSGGTALDKELFLTDFSDTKTYWYKSAFGFVVFTFTAKLLAISYRETKVNSTTSTKVFEAIVRENGEYTNSLGESVSYTTSNMVGEGMDPMFKHIIPGYLEKDDIRKMLQGKTPEEFNIALSMGIDLRYDNEYALRYAIKHGRRSIIKFLVSKGADIHAINEDALILAIKHGGSLSVVKCLESIGADIHADNDYALKFASENGDLPLVKFLVSKGADIHADDDTALKFASENGHLSVVKFLVSKGADIHADDDQAVMLAHVNGHPSVVKFLVSKGANISTEDD